MAVCLHTHRIRISPLAYVRCEAWPGGADNEGWGPQVGMHVCMVWGEGVYGGVLLDEWKDSPVVFASQPLGLASDNVEEEWWLCMQEHV